MTNPIITNSKRSGNPDYVVETEEVTPGVQRQVVKVANTLTVDTTGLATSALQTTGNVSLASIDTKIDALTTPSDTQPISAASLPLPTGAATSANQSTTNTSLSNLLTELQLKADLTETQPVSLASVPLPTGAGTSANQTTIIGHIDTLESKLTTLINGFYGAALTDCSNVGASDTSVELLAENSERKGASFYNDSDKSAYLKLGSTASTTSFTIKIAPQGFYELTWPCSTSAIDCIWEASPTGDMRITEIS